MNAGTEAVRLSVFSQTAVGAAISHVGCGLIAAVVVAVAEHVEIEPVRM